MVTWIREPTHSTIVSDFLAAQALYLSLGHFWLAQSGHDETTSLQHLARGVQLCAGDCQLAVLNSCSDASDI